MVAAKNPRQLAPAFNKERFGAFLKTTRRGRGLTQPALASRAGLSTQLVSNLECGRATPTVESLCLLAGALEVDPAKMLGAGIRPGRGSKPSEIERVVSLLSRFNAREMKEAIGILEAMDRLKGHG